MKKKEITIDGLALMVKKGFDGVDVQFDGFKKGVKKEFDGVNKRLEKIEGLILSDYKTRIEKLEGEMKELKDSLAL